MTAASTTIVRPAFLRHLLSAALTLLLVLQAQVGWGQTAQSLPFSQNWGTTGLITTNDNWNGVAGMVGFLGDIDAGSPTGVDPQTLTGAYPLTAIDVIANQTNPNTSTAGGVAEFEITNPTVALQGSGTADAPYLLIAVATTNRFAIQVSYNVRDIDGSTDNAVQAVALQYRVGISGNFTNIAAGFVADATTGPSLATLVTPVGVTLPAACDNQAVVQLRIMTTNAAGNDEWVGIDEISITGTFCSDALTCNNNGECSGTGGCNCDVGFVGASCNTCGTNYYNYPNCTFCLASTTCNGHGTCTGTGGCGCSTGYAGATCDQCAPDYYGYPNCTYCPASQGFTWNGTTCVLVDADGDGVADIFDACQAVAAVTGSPLFRAATCDAVPGAFITYAMYSGVMVASSITTCPAGSSCAGGTAPAVACSAGSFSSSTGASTCASCSATCGSGSVETQACTSTTDRVCTPDTDGDGLDDLSDACPNTPGGEAVSATGCSCSEVQVSDGLACTQDVCVAGVVSHPPVSTVVTLSNAGSPPAGTVMAQGSASAVIFGFTFAGDACTSSLHLSAADVHVTGTVQAGDLSDFRLVHDVDGSGSLSATDVVLSSVSSFTPGTALSFTMLPPVSFTGSAPLLVVAAVSSTTPNQRRCTCTAGYYAVSASPTGTVVGSAVGNEITFSSTDSDGDGIADVGDACQATSAVTGSTLFRAPTCDANPGSFITYSSVGGVQVATAIDFCPAGSSCAGGTAPAVLCPAGRFSSATGQSSCALCVAGSFSSSAGSTSCASCPAGSVSSVAGSSSCTACSAGSFADASGMQQCTMAPPGSFVFSSGATTATLCPVGTFSDVSGSVSCSSCAPGRFSGSPGSTVCSDCSAGTYNPVTGASSCLSAPPGSFVFSSGATSALLCPVGTFSDVSGSTVCLSCPVGSTSPPGATSCTPTAPDSDGDGIPDTSDLCQAVGSLLHFDYTGCGADPGFFVTRSPSSFGVLVVTAVTECPAGSSCAGGTAPAVLCPAGRFSSATGQSSCALCLAGSFSSSAGSTSCASCPAGSVSSVAGSSSCTACSAGSFADASGMQQCTMAPPGSFVASAGAISATLCPVGKFSDVSGSTVCQDCSAGRFSSSPGSTVCTDCSSGTYNPSSGASSCLSAPAGFFVPVPAATSATPCPAGQFSSATGSVSCTSCSAGTYSPTQASTSCLSCSSSTTTGSAACLTYPGSPYCSGTGSATPSLSGGGGGTYTCSSGQCSALVIDASTGAIDLSASAPGTYRVCVSGACSDVTITAPVSLSSVSVSQTGGTNPSCGSSPVEFTVHGTYSDGTSLSATEATAVWSPGLITVQGLSFSMASPSSSSVSCSVTSSRACMSSSTPVASSNSVSLVVVPYRDMLGNTLSISQTVGSASTCSGSPVEFRVTGTYSDGSSATNDLSATWSAGTMTIVGQSFGFSASATTPSVSASSVTSSGACVSNSGSVASPPDFALSVSPALSIVPSSVVVSQVSGTSPTCSSASNVAFRVDGMFSDGALFSSRPASEFSALWGGTVLTIQGRDFAMASPVAGPVSCSVSSSRACMSSSTPVASSNSVALSVTPSVSISSVSLSLTSGSNPGCAGSPPAQFSAEVHYSDLSSSASRPPSETLFEFFKGGSSMGSASTNPLYQDNGLQGSNPFFASASSSRACLSGPSNSSSTPVSLVVSSAPNAGTGGFHAPCENSAPIQLFSLLTGNPAPGGSWFYDALGGLPPTPVAVAVYNPATSAAGPYLYVVSAPGCGPDTAILEMATTYTQSWHPDVDADGYGAAGTTGVISCTPIPGLVPNDGDCNDSDANIRPNASEVCDAANVDEDCDGLVNEGVQTVFVRDLDGDGHADVVLGSVLSCTVPAGLGWTSAPIPVDDCDDGDAARFPGRTEDCDDKDNDCDALTSVDFGCDDDNDGYCDLSMVTVGTPSTCLSGGGDCDDTDASRSPGDAEVCDAANVDEDCDGLVNEGVQTSWYPDLDGDGFGSSSATAQLACTAPAFHVSNYGDCDDTRASVRPGAPELCDNLDNDCDGTVDETCDQDNDNYCTSLPPGATSSACPNGGGDCDDGDASVHPGAAEVCGNLKDDDCDGFTDPVSDWALDADNDGWYTGAPSSSSCAPSSLHRNLVVLFGGNDCADNDASRSPGDAEVCDGVDQDCDGAVDNGFANTDGDALANCLDPDDDNDGLSDTEELAIGTDPLDPDSDDDGPSDSDERGTGTFPRNTDGDLLIDALDPDDDGDGVPTISEGVADADLDGLPNFLDTDDDADGIATLAEGSGDPDNDGVPNRLDNDSDGDTIGDSEEFTSSCSGSLVTNVDTDGDGVPDFLDQDSDADGVLDVVEAGDASLTTAAVDTDGDCARDYRDGDSDADGLDDSFDSCRIVAGQVGSTCNDGNPATTGDVLGAGCVCAGTLSSACTDPVASNYVASATPNNLSCTYCPATVVTDATLSSAITIGGGIPNTHMSVGTNCKGMEVGLSVVERFTGSILPSGSVYTTFIGNSPTSATNPAPAAGLARWNYVMSVDLGTYDFSQVHVYLDQDRDPASGPPVAWSTVDVSAYLQSIGQQGLHKTQDSQNPGFAFWSAPPFSFPAFDPNVPGTYEMRVRLESSLTGVSLMSVPITVVVLPRVQLAVRALLDGPYVDPTPAVANGDGRMRDDLRSSGLLPLQQPYCSSAFSSSTLSYCGTEATTAAVLSVSDPDNAIVDWMLLELRSSSSAGTVPSVHRRACLVQSDGDMVDMDGTSPVSFVGVMPGDFHVVALHRNHLGCMTTQPVSVSASLASSIDLSLSTTPTYGTDARKGLDGRMLMWGGNARPDDRLRYTGTANDRDPALIAVGGFTPTASLGPVYRLEDSNMDGFVKYTGAGNDREGLLINVNWGFGTISVTRQRLQQLP